ncbi:hypothetical protein, partial [Kingella kingae]
PPNWVVGRLNQVVVAKHLK